MADAQDALGTPTDHSTFTAVEGMMRALHRWLTSKQAIDFVKILP